MSTAWPDTSPPRPDTSPPRLDSGQEPLDADGDGWSELEDCNDADARAFPGNPEVCDDGVDNDCNGYRDDWDQACLPDSGCAVGNAPSGLFAVLAIALFTVRLIGASRVSSSRP